VDEQEISFGRRAAELAAAHPEKPAVIFLPQAGEERIVSWRELDRASNQIARLLAARGVHEGATVVVGGVNSPEHILVTVAAWKLGALMLPLRAVLPARERDAILAIARPALIFADWEDVAYPVIHPADLSLAAAYDDTPLPDDPPHPGKAIASGGSTGRAKIVVDRTTHPVRYAARAARLGGAHGQVQLLCAPLYHNSPFLAAYGGLADDHTLVLMEHFDAEQAVAAIERYHVNYAYMPPIIMRRIIMLPGVRDRDFSSIQALQSSAAPCPPWLKQAWIDLIGAEKVYEVYGSTEGVGATTIRGDEWLTHPGSVGLPLSCELRILGEDGTDVPPGTVGEIYMRPIATSGPTFTYIGGAQMNATDDGFYSVGDLGWVDDAGYLFIADRRVDLIITGGANCLSCRGGGGTARPPRHRRPRCDRRAGRRVGAARACDYSAPRRRASPGACRFECSGPRADRVVQGAKDLRDRRRTAAQRGGQDSPLRTRRRPGIGVEPGNAQCAGRTASRADGRHTIRLLTVKSDTKAEVSNCSAATHSGKANTVAPKPTTARCPPDNGRG